MSTIVLDAPGGDYGLAPNLAGARAAVAVVPGLAVTLAGPRAEILAALAGAPFTVVDAPQNIEMHESPVTALRQKRQSSIALGLREVRDGRAEGFVSAGNTGAVMAAAKTILGLIPGIARPALVAPIPVLAGGGWTMLIDVGANVDCKPKHLAQFALMGSVYKERALGINRPRVGLLSVGTETAKGNELTKAAFALLEKLPLNFIGNVEGSHLMDGSVDVVVADGFAGNIALKFGETVALGIFKFIKDRVARDLRAKAGAALLKPVFRDLKKMVDYAEYGGAPLLGVKGCCIIAHGKSDARAIGNALRTADEFARHEVNAVIEEQMAEINRRGLLNEAPDEVAK